MTTEVHFWPGDRVQIRDEPSAPLRRAWVLRKLDEARTLVWVADIHSETVATNRLGRDPAPIEDLHPIERAFDLRVRPWLAQSSELGDDELCVEAAELFTSPLRRTFLLDTSVIRGVSDSDLRNLADRVPLEYSSYSVWEMISKLPTDFRLVRANVLKTDYLRHLDDPHSTFLAAAKVEKRRELEDADTINRLRWLLRESDSWEAYKGRCWATGQPWMAEIHEGAREVFDDGQEPEHVRYVGRLTEYAKTHGLDPANDDTAMWLIQRFVEADGRRAMAEGARRTGLFERMELWRFVRAAYLTFRIQDYLRSGKRIDGNDYQDGRICQHLHLYVPRTLVTNDKAFLAAVQGGLDILKRKDVGFLTRVCGWPIPEDMLVEAED